MDDKTGRSQEEAGGGSFPACACDPDDPTRTGQEEKDDLRPEEILFAKLSQDEFDRQAC